MPTFDIVVVGSGGGPDESDLSAYLLKPSDTEWWDGIIALDAGSGVGALNRILQHNPFLFNGSTTTTNNVDSPTNSTLAPHATLTALRIYSYIKSFLITHAHLDHITGLVLSAGSLSGARKRVYGLKDTLDSIASVFNDRLWPNLASYKQQDHDYKLLLSPLPSMPTEPTQLLPTLSVYTLPLSHGVSPHDPIQPVSSTAFLLQHIPTQQHLLFFGDVEPDSLSRTPSTRAVWSRAAPLIPHALPAVFIECSWPEERQDETLYGHLSPRHLVDELVVLATEVYMCRRRPKQGQLHNPPNPSLFNSGDHGEHENMMPTPIDLHGILKGLTIYITHCKTEFVNVGSQRPMRDVIVEQIRRLVRGRGLGAAVVPVTQGSLIHV
ncbi:hypothetical protein AMATHDRAFT_70624 [Amanita thiersii Skay4041]|uniref:Cyclic-AMP phosphodiesterase n=1 Tax=Amanita thiersii Skay4041 TaxID=703135 RepID=A0A2A9NEQ4_9AGAR|nr:hypothetical protein AMATHDRAFT_70624 [Amanita thiersii Skay4041]